MKILTVRVGILVMRMWMFWVRQQSWNLRLDLRRSMRVQQQPRMGGDKVTIDTYGSSNDAYVEGGGDVLSPGLMWWKYADVLHRKTAYVLHRSCVPVTAWEENSDRDGRRERQVKVSFESLHETEARTIVLPPFVSSYVEERTAEHLIESRQQSLAKALPPKATAAYVS